MKNKKIWLLFITFFSFLSCTMIQNVYADEKKKECPIKTSDGEGTTSVEEYYNINAVSKEKNDKTKKTKYEVTMAPAKKTKVVFTATAKEGEIEGSNKLSSGKSIIVWSNEEGKINIDFKAPVKKSYTELEGCSGDLTYNLTSTELKGDAKLSEEKTVTASTNFESDSDTENALNCSDSKSVGGNDGNKLICSARKAMKITIVDNDSFKSNDVKKFKKSNVNLEEIKKFKCDVNSFKDIKKLTDYKSFYADDDAYKTAKDANYYYQNRNYLYAWDETIETGKYTYNTNLSTPETATTTCKIKCEEGVAVEYGPPIASKAGLCFEYKVRVTSSVRCYMSKKPNKPVNKYKVCTPAPTCTGVGRSGAVYFVRQGGPNEDFDKCIKSCDGGKYTKKCSNSCYKKVYGSTSKTSNINSDYSTSKLKEETDEEIWLRSPLEYCMKKNGGGCYSKEGGTIKWNGSGAGRWYSLNNYYPGSEYQAFDDGFYRHVYSDGSVCHDTCYWQVENCGNTSTYREGKVYLNDNVADMDYEQNVKEYNRVLKTCKAAASCSTKTAEFTIAVDYTDSSKKVKRIYYPYSENSITNISKQGEAFEDVNKNNSLLTKFKDKISTTNKEISVRSDTSTNSNTSIFDGPWPQGCYKAGDSHTGFYQVAWTFPGSWINNKTGEVTFKQPAKNGEGWRNLPKKFCMPLDAQNVNMTWWNTYYGEKLIAGSYSINDGNVTSECKSSRKDTIYNYKNKKSYSSGDVTYNIHGATRDFGYFGWNINIDCFYALNTSGLITDNHPDSKDIPVACKNNPTESARVRTVDLTNLFPATDGTTKNSDSTTTGRTPGFNWSTYATISEGRNPNYASDPNSYLADVQKLGYSVYSDSYLDYEITLDKDKLSELKRYTNGGNEKDYTAFNGDSTISKTTGVTRYTSNLLGSLGSNIKRPSPAARECNNMKNYKSDECQKAVKTK